MSLFKEDFINYVEHPRGIAYIRTEYGVTLRVKNGSGQVLYSFDYTKAEFDQINASMAVEWMDVSEPVDVVEPPEPTPDPAPRATGGTPEVDPAKPDAPRARANARRTTG